MKKIILFVISIFLVSTCFSAYATSDVRLDMRTEDMYTPHKDGLQFTRYTPWLKMLHPMSQAEILSNVHGGEGCQQIRCLDISPTDNNLIFFGTDTTGVWKSEDGGEFWYNTNKNMIPSDVADVFCHPSNTNIVLAYQKDGGIYRSIDKGDSWSLVFEDYLKSSMVDKLIANDSSGNIYAVTGSGVIKSTNSGETWTLLLESGNVVTPNNVCGASSIAVSNDGQTIVAAYSTVDGFNLKGVYASFDGGETWSSKNATEFGAYAIIVDPSNSSRWIASFKKNGSDEYSLYYSTDNGANWNNVPTVENSIPIVRIRIANDKLYITYRNRGQSLKYIGTDKLDRLGWSFLVSWESVDISAVGSDTFRGGSNMYYSQGIDFSGNVMYLCNGAVYRSTDSGETFARKSSGFSGISVDYFNMSDAGKMLLSVTDVGTVISDSNYTSGNVPTFTKVNSYITTMSIIDPNNEQHVIAWDGASNTAADKVLGIIESFDGGVTFGEQKENTHATINPVVMQYDADDSNTIYTSSFTSYDNGSTWVENKYFIIAISSNNPNKMVAIDEANNQIMYTADKGNIWKSIGTSKTRMSGFFDIADDDVFWFKALYDVGTIKLSTGEMTSIKEKLPYRCYNTIAQNPKNPNHILVSLYGYDTASYCPSIYESIDHGNTWHVVPGFFGIRSLNANAICFSTTTNEVFLGSTSGIYVYEYNNFKYYESVILKSDNSKNAEKIQTTVERNNDKIVAPELPFSKKGKKFWGWYVNGDVYLPGETVFVE